MLLQHAETFGDPNNDMFIVLHGGPGGDYRKELKFKALADDGYYVVFFDQRRAGLSRRHNSDVFTINTYLEDLRSVIEYYKTGDDQKVYFLGHSWGGMYATIYINSYTEDIAGAVLSEPGGFTNKQVEDYLSRAFALNYFDEWLNDVAWDDQFITAEGHIRADYRHQTAIVNPLNAGIDSKKPLPAWRKGAVCSRALMKNTPHYDWTTNLDKYTTQVLFLYSEKNSSYGRSHARRVSSAYPNVRLKMVSGVGHDMDYNGFEEYYLCFLD